MEETIENTTFLIPLHTLEAWNPFSSCVWHIDSPITKDEVKEAVEGNHTTSRHLLEFEHVPRKFHIERIAHFVLYGWKDPIQIDVGVPSLGCHISWIILDGNHRLAAAFYLENPTIPGEISGCWEHAKSLGIIT